MLEHSRAQRLREGHGGALRREGRGGLPASFLKRWEQGMI